MYRKCRAGTQIIFPESGRGLGHVTPTIFGIQSNLSPELLELETSNLVHDFVWVMPSGRTNNFPRSGRGLSHVTPKIFGIPSNISSKLLKLETSNLVHGFVWRIRRTMIRRPKNPPKVSVAYVTGPCNYWHTTQHFFKTI